MGGVEFYLAAFLMGLAGSLHCLGMCGPIFLTTSTFYSKPQQYVFPVMLHHAGKIIAYMGIGVLMGLLGKGVSLLWFQNQVMVFCGFILIFYAIGGFLNWRFLGSFNGWVSQKMSKLIQQKGQGIFVLGIVNGLIPCGLVYAAAVGAAAMQQMASGMLFMALFGLGTMPALTFVGFSRWLLKPGKFKNRLIWKQLPMLVLGLWLLLKGLGLGIPFISPDLQNHNPSKNCCTEHHKH